MPATALASPPTLTEASSRSSSVAVSAAANTATACPPTHNQPQRSLFPRNPRALPPFPLPYPHLSLPRQPQRSPHPNTVSASFPPETPAARPFPNTVSASSPPETPDAH